MDAEKEKQTDPQEPVAIKSSILLKKLGEGNFLDLALKDSFDVIITDPMLLIKNLTGTMAVKPEELPKEEKPITESLSK